MKTKDIAVGLFYHDNKVGVREVISIEGDVPRVTYRILSAKVEREYSYNEKKVISVIGTTSSCELASFSQWAKVGMKECECQQLLIELAAKKLHLPPGEVAFMKSLSDEYLECSISFLFNETRQARGVEKKGLAIVDQPRSGSDGHIRLTSLGIAWMRANIVAA